MRARRKFRLVGAHVTVMQLTSTKRYGDRGGKRNEIKSRQHCDDCFVIWRCFAGGACTRQSEFGQIRGINSVRSEAYTFVANFEGFE